MGIWKIVSGILSIVLCMFVLFQSCAAGLLNTMTSNGEVSGSAGVIVAILLLAGGIVSIASRNAISNGGNIALIVLFGIAALIGYMLAGSYTDLTIWATWCLICAVVAAMAIAADNVCSAWVYIVIAVIGLIIAVVGFGMNMGSDKDEAKPSNTAKKSISVDDGNANEDNIVQELEVKSDEDKDDISKELDIKGYKYKSDYFNYFFLTIKNNSDLDLRISADVNFYGADGNLVGANSKSQEAVESGYSTIFYFMPDEDFSDVEYEIGFEEEPFYDCVLSDISYEGTVAKNKVILSATNNGDKPAEFVEASVLFFKNGEVVGFSQNYTTDDDSELKPGKTINKEMDCYNSFDDYLVFFSGRR